MAHSLAGSVSDGFCCLCVGLVFNEKSASFIHGFEERYPLHVVDVYYLLLHRSLSHQVHATCSSIFVSHTK